MTSDLSFKINKEPDKINPSKYNMHFFNGDFIFKNYPNQSDPVWKK